MAASLTKAAASAASANRVVENDPPHDGTISAEVARGRSVVTDDGLQLAGATVTLPDAEARKLMAAGFLVDPDAPLANETNGPSFERRG